MVLSEPAVRQIIGKSIETVGRTVKIDPFLTVTSVGFAAVELALLLKQRLASFLKLFPFGAFFSASSYFVSAARWRLHQRNVAPKRGPVNRTSCKITLPLLWYVRLRTPSVTSPQ